MRHDNAFVAATASALVACDLLGKPMDAVSGRIAAYARRWDLDPVCLACAVYCEAELLKARVTAHEEVTKHE